MPQTTSTGIRERAREEMTTAIKQAARERLAQDGANLSLRAVARDVGVVSSAVYRYFPSRDDLLTALVIEAYDDLADAAERAEARVRRDPRARWTALARAIRGWALDHPPEYALLYGSPVPGYRAPQATTGPANRPLFVFAAILRDGYAAGMIEDPVGDRLSRSLRVDTSTAAQFVGLTDLPVPLVTRALVAWTQLFGAISFELFGRFSGGEDGGVEGAALFDFQVRAMADYLGLH